MSLRDIITFIRLLFRKDRESYFVLYRILGFFPCEMSYYRQALLHKSLSVRNPNGRLLNNERLEFLGDAILDAVVGDIVYRHFPGKREGFLTNVRSKIVQRETLNRLAVELGIDKLVKYSAHSHSHNSYMYGNAFEAFVGAIYIDRGYAYCMKFMQERVIGKLIEIDQLAYQELNFKSKLIEWGQKKRVQICFELVEQRYKREEACSPVFETKVLVEGLFGGNGVGYSKKESQQIAAKTALGRLKKDKEFLNAVFESREIRTMQSATVPPVETAKEEPEVKDEVPCGTEG